MFMAPSRNYLLALKAVSLTVAFIFMMSAVTFPPLTSVGLGVPGGVVLEKKTVLGSRPPGCVNKCLNCRPCKATLVIPSHQKKKGLTASTSLSASHRDDENYYLLSWKCRCGDKLFQP